VASRGAGVPAPNIPEFWKGKIMNSKIISDRGAPWVKMSDKESRVKQVGRCAPREPSRAQGLAPFQRKYTTLVYNSIATANLCLGYKLL